MDAALISEIFGGIALCLSAIFGTGAYASHKKHKKNYSAHDDYITKLEVKIKEIETRQYEQSKTIFDRLDKIEIKLDKIIDKI